MAWYTNSWMKCRITRMGMKALRWTSKQNPHSTSCFIAFMVGFIRNLLDTYQRHVATTSPTWYTCSVTWLVHCLFKCVILPQWDPQIWHTAKISQTPRSGFPAQMRIQPSKMMTIKFPASCMCSFDIRICDTVDTIRRAASRTRNAGSSLANWAFVSFQ